MELATGRWVAGDDFFGRQAELEALTAKIRAGNHVLLAGPRRMGKTSIARELGRRLSEEGWVFLFADVEAAGSPEDAITEIARAAHAHPPLARHYASRLARWLGPKAGRVEELSAWEFGIKVRAALNAETWRRHGEQLFRRCAKIDQRVLLVVDELPIFLKRLIMNPDRAEGLRRADLFLSWLRSAMLALPGNSPVFLVSGSIGLAPLVRRYGLADRVNHFDTFRLGPWSREESVACFETLATSTGVECEPGVADLVYERIGIGIPHHVQAFFARLWEFTVIEDRSRIFLADVDTVYRTGLLGPSGLHDLAHWQTRLKDGFDDDGFRLAMEILAHAALAGRFTARARLALAQRDAAVISQVEDRILEVLEVLTHDGYLSDSEGGYRFDSLVLRDWFAARFRGHREILDPTAKAE